MEISDVSFSPKSMVDDFGRVFFFQGKVYRAIFPANENYCHQLLNSPLFIELQEKELIPDTKISDLKLTDYNLILEHEKLVEIQQHEWSFEMFKSAALMVLNVNNICNKYGYELKDAHTFNVLFRGVNPVWVDLGSIAPIRRKNEWIAYDEFLSVFYLPIQFYLQNDNYIVRKLVESNFYRMQTAPFQQLWDSGLINLLQKKPFLYQLYFRNILLKVSDRYNSHVNRFVRRFNKYYHKLFNKPAKLFVYRKKTRNVAEITSYLKHSVLTPMISQWSNYHKSNYELNGEVVVSDRFKRLIELLTNYCSDAKSSIDLAGNEGFFSSLLLQNTRLEKVLLTDYDANAIDVAFKTFEQRPDNRASVALLNFMFTPALKETTTRFKSDIVIALAVTHHLILTQQFAIQTIFERLKLYSNKYVVVEFMPLGLWSIHTKEGSVVPDWYNQKWFEMNFNKYFTLLHVEQLEENRIVYIGCLKSLLYETV